MKKMIKETTSETICSNLIIAKDFFHRLTGLMFKKSMPTGHGLLIEKCNSIHTFFCYFPLDVCYLDKNNKVIKITKNFLPWRIGLPVWGASKVLELKAGDLKIKLQEGDQLKICTS